MLTFCLIFLGITLFMTDNSFQNASNTTILDSNNRDQSPSLPNPNQLRILNGNSESEYLFTGTGKFANVSLWCNKTSAPIPKLVKTTLDIPLPSAWSIILTNITFSDIKESSKIFVAEDSFPSSGSQDVISKNSAMQFNISSPSYIKNVSIYVLDFKTINTVNFHIYNATSRLGVPAPDKAVFMRSISTSGISLQNSWLNFTFSPLISLDPSKTYNSAFFVVIIPVTGGGGAKFAWAYRSDGGEKDEGAAYIWESPNWSPQTWDFYLKVGLVNCSVSAKSIDLRVNNFTVQAIQPYKAVWLNNSQYTSSGGPVSFVLTASVPAYALVQWTVKYQHKGLFTVTTVFQGIKGASNITWSAIYNANFVESSYAQSMNFSLPIWTSVTNISRDQLPYTGAWSSKISGRIRFVAIRTAMNGVWKISCNDTNYVQSVYVKRSGLTVTTVNSTDTIEIYSNFREYLRSGDANLTVIPITANYNDTSGEQIKGNKTIKFSPAWNIETTALDHFTQVRIWVLWTNGTASGINSTTLTVLPIPTTAFHLSHDASAVAGQYIYIRLNFSNANTKTGLSGARIFVLNGTDSSVWPIEYLVSDYSNGTYRVRLRTVGLLIGQFYNVTLNVTKRLFLPSFLYNITFFISGGGSSIGIVSNIKILNSTHYILDPGLYVDGEGDFTINYTSVTTGEGLESAEVKAIIWAGPDVFFSDLHDGVYRIYLQGNGFTANTNQTLQIQIQKLGYNPSFMTIIVPIRKLPTRIDTLPEYSNLIKYPEDVFELIIIYTDTYHEISIPEAGDYGEVTYSINGVNGTMARITQLAGWYKAEIDLKTCQVVGGFNYNITVTAYSQNYELATTNISITIIPKLISQITLISIPDQILRGQLLTIQISLTYYNETPISQVPIYFNITWDNGLFFQQEARFTSLLGIAEIQIQPLLSFKNITITAFYMGDRIINGSSISHAPINILTYSTLLNILSSSEELLFYESYLFTVRLTYTNNNTPIVNASVNLEITFVGTDQIDHLTYLTNLQGDIIAKLDLPAGTTELRINVAYEGEDYIYANSTVIQIAVVTLGTFIMRYSYIWLPILFGIVAGSAYYHWGYQKPKQRRLRTEWKEIHQKFLDADNVEFLFIISKESGMPIFSQAFKARTMDSGLVGGFLTAISTFQRELILEKKAKANEWAITYQDFLLYVIEMQTILQVFILTKPPSERLKGLMTEFANQIEQKYLPHISNFRGSAEPFIPIKEESRSFFETYLLEPSVIRQLTAEERKPLSKLELAVYNFAFLLIIREKEFQSMFVINSFSTARGEPAERIATSVYKLYKNKVFLTVSEDIAIRSKEKAEKQSLK